MDLENNNNTVVPEFKKEDVDKKRSAPGDDNDGVENIKKVKLCGKALKVEDAHVPESNKKTLAQSPKKRIELRNIKPTINKNEAFIYGNYRHYYGKRILDTDFHDVRLDVLGMQPELFRGKQLLDVGCNSGHFSLEIAKKFEVKSLVGLDIDRALISEAQLAVNLLKRSSNISAATAAGKFPYNVKFVHGNFVLADDVLLEIVRPQFDVILCLSVTKWIHLNFCDAGLKQAFRRMYLLLHPGGKLILEPQAFDTYKRRKKLTESIRKNYEAIQFKPDQFASYLLSQEVGFARMQLMGVPAHCQAGFKRPILIFSKV
ncbi:hypothetical protein AWZ03_012444 [Drosophila navojoa]|uniref:RNA methyltransferase n=1 Tax=Drosophila navojoa TaxID=7232 RepID=A0A484AXJ3_DRONA|nr:probable RNA methyltransferase CG1239 [Drosophila navojoa]TDG41134.1 hypothetical protein AWZ03_012444 [Drosophila navojoa]